MPWFARAPLGSQGVECRRHDRNLDFCEDNMMLYGLYLVLHVWAAMSEGPRNGLVGVDCKTC